MTFGSDKNTREVLQRLRQCLPQGILLEALCLHSGSEGAI